MKRGNAQEWFIRRVLILILLAMKLKASLVDDERDLMFSTGPFFP